MDIAVDTEMDMDTDKDVGTENNMDTDKLKLINLNLSKLYFFRFPLLVRKYFERNWRKSKQIFYLIDLGIPDIWQMIETIIRDYVYLVSSEATINLERWA